MAPVKLIETTRRLDLILWIVGLRSPSIDEIIAEKVRALLQRTKPRDVFDVWFLMERKGKKLDVELLRAKLRRSYDAAPDKSKKNIENYEMSEIVSKMEETVTGRAWQNELGGLLMRPKPEY